MKKYVILSMFFALIFVLAACKPSGGEESTNSHGTTPESTTTANDAASGPVTDDLGEMDFEGYVFRVLEWPNAGGEHTNIVPEEIYGDILNDSIYNANKRVEERFDLTFERIDGGMWNQAPELIRKTVKAGENAYDLALIVDRQAISLAMEGRYFYSADELTNINLEKPYWDKFINDALSIDGVKYIIYGSNVMSTMDYMSVLVYNKQIMQNEGIAENIYDLVRSGKWTMAKMYELGRSATRELDGDNIATDADQYGMVFSYDYYYPCFWYADKIPLVAKNSDDLPYFNVPGNQRLFDIFEKQYEYAHSGVEFDVLAKAQAGKLTKYTWEGYITVANMFADGHALFAGSSMYQMQSLRYMEDDYGIIPYPTLDEQPAGTPYIARIGGGNPLIVPSSNPNANIASAVLEALACEYYLNVIPSYYSLVVQQKSTRDEESIEILDMLRANKFMDLGDSYWAGDIRGVYQSLPYADSNIFASKTEEIEIVVKGKLETAIEAFRAAKAQ